MRWVAGRSRQGGKIAVDCVAVDFRGVVLQSVASSARGVVVGMGSTSWFEGSGRQGPGEVIALGAESD